MGEDELYFTYTILVMDREIKLRLWDTLWGKWYEPVYRAHEGLLYEVLIMPNGSVVERDMNGLSHGLPRYVIQQYTGLKDKNGKEIYEGDIVKTKWQNKAEMIWLECDAAFALRTVGDVVKDEIMYGFKDTEMEIIGNIYENPELIK